MEPFAPIWIAAPLEVDLDAPDAVERLLAVRATTAAPPWREAAGKVWVRCVEDMEETKARQLLEALIESVRTEPDALFAIARDLGAKVAEDYPEASAQLRHAAFDLLSADPRALELGCLLVKDLVENLERDAVQPVIDELLAHHAAYEVRVQLFEVLREGWRVEALAVAQAEAAIALAPDPTARLELLVKLAAVWGGYADEEDREHRLAQRTAVTRRIEALVVELSPGTRDRRVEVFAVELSPGTRDRRVEALAVELSPGTRDRRVEVLAGTLGPGLGSALVRAHLELAAPPSFSWTRRELSPPASPEALDHAARADEIARSAGVELALLHQAAHAHAEQLLHAGELVRAEAVLAKLPGLDDDHLSMVGMLEHVRRLLGAAPPPPSAFVVTDPADPIFDFFAPKLPEGFAEFFAHDRDPLRLVRENRHASPEKVREWSHGGVRIAADLDSQLIFGPLRDYACECTRYLGVRYRGFVCERCGVEVISSTTRTYRPAHISLARPVVHPWYAGALATLLEMTKTALRDADPSELSDRLRRFDVFGALETAREGYRRSERDKLPILEALHESLVKPQWLLLEQIPVWAPGATLPGGVDREKLRAAYVALLDAPDPRRGVDALFACFT